jgi:hypothetical protein
MKNNCPVHGATECGCTLEYRVYSRIMNLPSYGLIADNQENPMISRVSVIRIVEQEAQDMRRAAGPGDRAMAEAASLINKWRYEARKLTAQLYDMSHRHAEELEHALAIERSQTPQANSQDGQQ